MSPIILFEIIEVGVCHENVMSTTLNGNTQKGYSSPINNSKS